MPLGDKTKVPAFKMWSDGKSLREIIEHIRSISRTKPTSVMGWVKDWERGKQGTWSPNIKR